MSYFKQEKTRPKMTKEELLAGKCSPQDKANFTDPRFKSPDELLMELAAKKTVKPLEAIPNAQPKLDIEITPYTSQYHQFNDQNTSMPSFENEKSADSLVNKSEEVAPDMVWENQIAQHEASRKDVLSEMEELKIRYQREITQWTEYHQNVKLWQSQVLEIIQKLKKEAGLVRNLKNENQNLRDKLIKKDVELARHRESSEGETKITKLTGWLKGFQKA